MFLAKEGQVQTWVAEGRAFRLIREVVRLLVLLAIATLALGLLFVLLFSFLPDHKSKNGTTAAVD